MQIQSGILLLIEKGINLTCVDYSREMLNVFAKKLNGKKPRSFARTCVNSTWVLTGR
jgi:hypothetical protein